MFALALSRSGASLEQCLQAYAFGWAENMVQAAIKSVPLGQNAGQRILTQLAQHIAQIWQQRSDRYSALRGQQPPSQGPSARRVEMSYIGG